MDPYEQTTLRSSIADLVHSYSDAVVRRDVNQWASTWQDEAKWILPGSRVSVGKAAIVELWTAAMDRFDAVFQVVHNGSVVLSQGEGQGLSQKAIGQWYVHEYFRKRTGEVGILLARYDDEYQAVAGVWRFTSRSLVVTYQGPPDLSGPFPKVES